MAHETERVTVDGIQTVVREAGPHADRPGEAVVLMHGNPGSGAEWAGLQGELAGTLRSVSWDAPGFGQADKPDDFPQTVQAHADYAGKVIDQLRITRVHLVMHDLGGPWGLLWAVNNPDRVASVTLICTGVLRGYRWHTMARIWSTPVLGELTMAVTNRIGFRRLIGKWGNPRGLPVEFIDQMYDNYDRATRRAILRLYRGLPDPSARSAVLAEMLEELDFPALVIWGAHDPYLPAAYAERQREAFPRAQIRVLEDSGHWPHVDNAAKVNAAIVDFLTSRAEAGT